MSAKTMKIQVDSEIGKLEGVILHKPGPEIENMTPANAERALYSDILNLSVAGREYSQLAGVLQKLCKTYFVSDLLKDILEDNQIRENLISNICENEFVCDVRKDLLKLSSQEITRQLIEGVIMKKDSLTSFLSKQRYSLRPLHNFFFTRDASISIDDKVLIAKMANKVRDREALIMESIFDQHPAFHATTLNPKTIPIDTSKVTIEGGDILVARHDILLMGTGSRTTTEGVDFILKHLKGTREKKHIIVQELPYEPESFIHLDMVFTFLDRDACMVYYPIILKPNRYQTVHISIENGKVVSIKNQENLLAALQELGMDLKPVYCGGTSDAWVQQREQWHSGANFFAFAPGKVIGYERNVRTLEEMNKRGFEIIRASEVIAGNTHPDAYKKCVVSIEGSELARGGGGARCMTMPFKRGEVEW
ncbi:MAG: arginine deiminase [Bacteroidales bacterium]|nr:arginine deiminase [Bacteroidales bacterium]MCF8388196.1 arginine deiminase [Bacteroidales bacterium]MCF8399027.1 arginine deiminase [Bacteroidales bacterium]